MCLRRPNFTATLHKSTMSVERRPGDDHDGPALLLRSNVPGLRAGAQGVETRTRRAGQACAPPEGAHRAGRDVHAREYPVLDNQYRNGESQRSVQAATSRKRWTLAKRLPPTALAELRAFYEARKGPVEPFYVYDPYETSPKFSHDPNGATTSGRYVVRFDCMWTDSIQAGRGQVSIELIELA